jgi:hypothetical protein
LRVTGPAPSEGGPAADSGAWDEAGAGLAIDPDGDRAEDAGMGADGSRMSSSRRLAPRVETGIVGGVGGAEGRRRPDESSLSDAGAEGTGSRNGTPIALAERGGSMERVDTGPWKLRADAGASTPRADTGALLPDVGAAARDRCVAKLEGGRVPLPGAFGDGTEAKERIVEADASSDVATTRRMCRGGSPPWARSTSLKRSTGAPEASKMRRTRGCE